MALDIFNRPASEALQGFSADSAYLAFRGVNDVADIKKLLIQSLQAGYQQAITRIFELSSNATTFVQGRTQGTLALSRIIGPSKTAGDFISQFSSVCDLAKNTIAFHLNAKKGASNASCDNAEGSEEGFTATGCVINSLSFNVTSEQLVVNQQVQMQVVSLEKFV